MKVLIVDDDEHEAQSVRHFLTSHGHHVLVSSPHEHLQHVESFKPDVLVTDIFTHEKSPLQVVQELRAASLGLRLVAMDSAKKHRLPFYADVAMALGADAALMSPVDSGELLAVVGAQSAHAEKRPGTSAMLRQA